MQSSGCVENQNICVSCESRFTGVEGNGCRVAAGFVLYDLGADAFGPDGQLFHGSGTECIACGDDDLFAVLAEYKPEFGDACGFAGAVDAGNQHDGRAGLSQM
ncbi:hypothetical protein ES703_17317 [subsurface metagenome]